MKLIQLVYTSEIPKDGLSQKELTMLVRNSQRKNKQESITGVLFYEKNKIIQCVEGMENKVFQLYSNILNDHRHKKIDTKYELS